MELNESKMLAIASINMVNKDSNGVEHIKISQIKSDTKQFEVLDKTEIEKLIPSVAQKYPQQ